MATMGSGAGSAADRFAALMQAASDAILVGDWDSARFIDVNDAATHMFGYSAEELRQRTGRMMIPPGHDERLNAFNGRLRSEGYAVDSEMPHQRKDGSILICDLRVSRFQSDGRTYQVAIIRDVTEHVERQAVFRSAFLHGPAGLAIATADGTLTSVNPAFHQMLGYEADELVGRFVNEISHPDDRPRERELGQRLVAKEIDSYVLEKRYIHNDGHIVTGLMHIARCELPEGERFIAQVLDVTDHRRTQAQLHRAQQLASLGRMAAAVAHDINNPAAYLRLNLESLKSELAARFGTERVEDLASLIDDCTEGVARIGDIVRDLQLFGVTDAEAKPIDIGEVVRISCRLADHEIRHRARLTVEVEDNLPAVHGYSSKLGQVITNLLLNAGRAMENDSPEANEIHVRCHATSAEVVIEVSDNGRGLADAPEGLFDAFVASASSEGAGLGLWIAAQIVREHEGTIRAENNERGGAKFIVTLPVRPWVRIDSTLPETIPDAFAVLLVDDEPAMLRAYSRVLRAHQVTTETDGRAAIDRIKKGERFDAIVCDVMMPTIGGMDVYAAIEAIDRDQAARMLFVTGGAIDDRIAAFLDDRRSQVLRKPVVSKTLQAAIERVAFG